MSLARDGHLKLDETGEVFAPGLTSAALDAMAVRRGGEVRVRPNGSIFSTRTRVEGRAAFLAATFADGLVTAVELVLLDGPGSGGMAEQGLLKAEHERWLASLGVVLKSMPFMLDGRAIMPATVGPDHSMHALVSWGEVVSLIDPKNGGASVVLRYAKCP